MTATASAQTKDTIVRCLHMTNATIVQESPDKPNIFYGILKAMSIHDLAATLAQGVQKMGMAYPKTLVFCRRYVYIHYIAGTCIVQLSHALYLYLFPMQPITLQV